MPAYLCHGFRWHRRSIRVYVVVQNIDDAAPEWVIGRRSSRAMLESFYNLFDFLPLCRPPPSPSWRRAAAAAPVNGILTLGGGGGNGDEIYPDEDDGELYATRGLDDRSRSRSRSKSRSRKNSSATTTVGAALTTAEAVTAYPAPLKTTKMLPSLPTPEGQARHDSADDVLSQSWSAVRLLEEFDPTRLDEVSRPYAYVADYAVRIDLSVSLVEEMARYEERLRNWPGDRNGGQGGADYENQPPPMAGPYSDETGRKRQTAKESRKAGWLEKLRDQLQRGEEIRWYVVVNGDEERSWAAAENTTDPSPSSATASRGTADRSFYAKVNNNASAANVAAAAVNGGGGGRRDSSPTFRAQAEHHAQYTHQQNIFEDKDYREREREKLRQQLGAPPPTEDVSSAAAAAVPRGSSYNRSRSASATSRPGFGLAPPFPPPPPAKELPPILVPKMSIDGGGLRPKTPKTGGFRRLFGRSSKGGGGADESP